MNGENEAYLCDCYNSLEGWQTRGRDDWHCLTQVKLGRFQLIKNVPVREIPRQYLLGELGPLCSSGQDFDAGSYYNISYSSLSWMIPDLHCSLGGVTAPMLNASCEARELDIVRFHMCRASVPSFFSGVCDGAFTVCAVLNGNMRPSKVALVIYIFLPTCCLLGMVLVHLVAFLAQSTLTEVEENKVLRKRVKKQSNIYQQQLKNGNLERSLLCLGIVFSCVFY